MSSPQPAQVDRRLLLLWEEEPGPDPTPQPEYVHYVGVDVDGPQRHGHVVVGRTSDHVYIEIIDQYQFQYDSVGALARILRALWHKHHILSAYVDIHEAYQPIIDTLPGAVVMSRITRSRRNQIRDRVRTHVFSGTLDTTVDAVLTERLIRPASENADRDTDAVRSYNDALGLMVWSFDEARTRPAAVRLICPENHRTPPRSTTPDSSD